MKGIKVDISSDELEHCKRCGLPLLLNNRVKGYCTPCYTYEKRKKRTKAITKLALPVELVQGRQLASVVSGNCSVCGSPLYIGRRCKGMCRTCYERGGGAHKNRYNTEEKLEKQRDYKRLRNFLIKEGLWNPKKVEKPTHCSVCGADISDKHARWARGLCHNCYCKDHHDRNEERLKAYREHYNHNNAEQMRDKRIARLAMLRLEMIVAFGGKCKCCGESEPAFLTLDHVNNDGSIERRVRSNRQTIQLLKKLGWPKDGYQLLCYNCNMGKARNGGVCPHKRDGTSNG